MTEDSQLIKVLDHGYVRLNDSMGTDLTTVNAAKVSFDKRSTEFKERDEKLLHFLGDNNHTSPFRHSILQFEVYAPMFVKNQWWKYLVGHEHQEINRDPMLAWNESSRRYVTEEPVFYAPQWRSAPVNKKQGSGEFIPLGTTQLPDGTELALHEWLTMRIFDTIGEGVSRYNKAIEYGVAPEQARVFLPAYAMYIRWWWTASLQGVIHLIEQRTAPDAQWEFQEYAKAVEQLTRSRFPNAAKALLKR